MVILIKEHGDFTSENGDWICFFTTKVGDFAINCDLNQQTMVTLHADW